MSYIENLQINNDFAQSLEANALPIPPLPEEALDQIQEYFPHFFSTDERALLIDFTNLSLESLNIIFPLSTESQKVHYFGCGILGYGMQNWNFCYFLHTEKVQIAICLPWGNAFTDAEADKELLEKAYELLEVCGAYTHSEKIVRFVLDTSHIEWEVVNKKQEVLKCGQQLSSFLDALVHLGDEDNNISNQQWIRV